MNPKPTTSRKTRVTLSHASKMREGNWDGSVDILRGGLWARFEAAVIDMP